jgi:alkanesulfonate monooxygenase SsuD/methylene tetrahydromethanopterin reductase-like flavin-dependent oxidoreductase (luciferase family)
MKQGIILANIGTYSSPGVVVEMAKIAEASGWDAFLMWDHLGFVWDAPSCDPWVALTAVAGATSELLLGTAVTPVPRYRPQRLATTVSSLSHLTRAGLVLGVGIGGVPGEFAAFGEPSDPRERAERLDEGLKVISDLWSGREVNHRGRHYSVDGVSFSPTPPEHIPIWVGGNSKPAVARASRWDGWFADSCDAIEMTMEPDEFAAGVNRIRAQREAAIAFDFVLQGYSTSHDAGLIGGYERAGATWWMEAIHDIRGTHEEMVNRVRSGPARLA